MSTRGLVRGVVPALVAGLFLAGCTTAVRGSASPAQTSESAPTTTAPSTSEQPAADITPPPPQGVGRVLESHRIASVTALVPASFPDRTDSCYPSGPLVDAGDLDAAYFGTDTVGSVLERYGFVAAWGQCGSVPDGGPATLTLAVELSDPDSAVQAAGELVASQATDGFQEVDLGTDGGALLKQDGDQATVQAFVPVGRMLAYVWHETSAAAAGPETQAVLGDQVNLLRGFTPTPQADVPALPTDPQGLSAFTLDPPGDFRYESGPYDLDGYLRLAIDPAKERELLTANGFTGFYTKQSDGGDLSYAVALYTFPTSAQTNAVYTAFAGLETAAFGGTPFRLPAIPEAPCFSFEESGSFYQRCYVGYGSYLASVDVLGLTRADDYDAMNQLLPAQRDLIDG